MAFNILIKDDKMTLQLKGNVDLSETNDIKTALGAEPKAGFKFLTIQGEGLEYIDSSGVALMLFTKKLANEQNLMFEVDLFTDKSYNPNEIKTAALQHMKDYFNIDSWQINQPIILANVYTLLDTIEGVQTVQNVDVYNIVGQSTGYSKYAYDMKAATINGIIYPSLDPSIFEVKFPGADIQGRVVNF